MITKADQEWTQRVLMPYFGIKALRFAWSSSKKKYPDIWCSQGYDRIPVVTLTAEWAGHDTHLRRSQLVHESLHIARGLEHGVQPNGMDYNTHPEADVYSKAVYQAMLRGDRWVRNPKIRTHQPKNIYEVSLVQIAKKWDWNAIVADLRAKQARVPKRAPWTEFKPKYYLGNVMQIGPLPDYYEPKWAYSLGQIARGYRLYQWWEALHTIAGLHNLFAFTAQADPADIYIQPGMIWNSLYEGKTSVVELKARLAVELASVVGEDYVRNIDPF